MITITFEPSTPEQVAVLAKAMADYLKAGESTPLEAEVPKAPKTRKPAATQPAVEAAPPAPAEPAPAVESPSKPEVTLVQVRAKLAALKDAGKAVEARELLQAFGAERLTEIPADKYPELLA